jgi:thioredoxin reductase
MDLQKMDDAITSGSCDIIMSGRMFLCNEDLGRILETGEIDDLSPCIECGVCRGTSPVKDWMSHCTINPRLGMEHRADRLIQPVTWRKKIAIIGGGPSGIKCALWLKERGHTPVIFEKQDKLGGQVSHSDKTQFKWKMERYLEFLRHQVEKNNIEVRLGTLATPELVQAEGFDVVIAATGARPKAPNIPGVEYAKYNPVNVYDHLDEIGQRVVVIGSTSAPTEAALFLAEHGKTVTQIGRQNIVAYDLNPIHQRAYYNLWARDFGVEEIHNVTTTQIEPGKVTYREEDGTLHQILCDDVVAAGGMTPNTEAATAFYGSAPEYYAIGDCRSLGTMRTAIRDAYTLAMRI